MIRLPSSVLITLCASLWVLFAFLFDGTLTAVILAGPPALAMVLHRPAWGLILLIVLIPILSAYPGWAARGVNFGLPIFIFGCWGLHRLWLPKRIDPLPSHLNLWFLAFIFWIAFTSFLSPFTMAGLAAAFRYCLLAGVLVAIVNLLTWEQLQRTLFLKAMVLVPIAGYGLWQAVTFGKDLAANAASPNRVYSIYSNPNTFGVVMGHGIVILGAYLFLALTTKRITLRRGSLLGILAVALLALVGGLIVSISRAAGMYVVAALFILGFSLPKLRPATLGIPLTAAAITGVLFPSVFLLAVRPGSGMSYRDSLWSAGWQMLLDHPWTGVGTGVMVFESFRAEYLETAAHRGLLVTLAGEAHNVFLTKGAELGWFGLVLTVLFFMMLWLRIPGALREYREGDWLKGAAAAGVAGLTVRAMFESNVTLGSGHLADSLMFFLFAIALLAPRELRVPTAKTG